MRSFLGLLFVLLPSFVSAASIDNHVALADLKQVKIVCDVNVGSAELLLLRLELIDETYSQLLDAEVTPTMVIAFRGDASRYVTRGDGYVTADAVQTKNAIRLIVDQFQRNGIRLEQCAIAAKARHIDLADFLPAVDVVQNGYVSIVAYQNRGYALLPMD